jgi:predicted dehydrogenase
MSSPLQIGCIGVAGYAAHLIGRFDALVPMDRARLAAVDVSMSTPDERTAQCLDHQGARQINGVEQLLDHPGLDAVMIPTSIDSHLPFTKAALSRGLHVHCEKPITATVEDALAMIAARDAADRIVHVGFQDTYAASVQWAKGKILDGAVGKIQRVRVSAMWPRPDSYYNRNGWAGRISRDGQWVLDSPANNALIHQLNLALYLTGTSADASNRITRVEAELYRARPIENYDTCAIRCQTVAGCEILILLTHATTKQAQPLLDFEGEAGTLQRLHPSTCRLIRDGQVVELCEDDATGGAVGPMFENWLDHIEGKVDRSKCEIENAIETTRLVNAASQAAPVWAVDPQFVERIASARNPEDFQYSITDLGQVFEQCRSAFQLPSELGVAWARPGGAMDVVDYDKFVGPADPS